MILRGKYKMIVEKMVELGYAKDPNDAVRMAVESLAKKFETFTKKRVLGFTVFIFRENGSYSAWVPGLEIASQGDTVDKAARNVKEAIKLHLECMSPIQRKRVKKRNMMGKKKLKS